MKIVTNLFRVIIGLTFIFSGFVKLDDPTGFSYKLDEYFSVFAGDVETQQDSIYFEATFQGETFDYKRSLFVNENSIKYQPSYQIEKKFDENGDSSWNAQFSLSFDEQLVFSKEIVLADSSDIKKVAAVVKAGDKVVAEYNYDVQLAGFDPGEDQNIEVGQYVNADSWLVGFFQGMKPFALYIGVFVSILEVLLGFALLIGWKSRLTAGLILALTLFFTFLTFYSWMYDKVTDCGCFGDAIPLDPYQSFIKNIINIVLILVIFIWASKIKPIFSNPFAVKLMAIVVLISGTFAAYCKHYLPVIDFLKFKEGNNVCELMEVPEGERVNPLKIMKYQYQDSTGKKIVVTYNSDNGKMEPSTKGLTYVTTLGEEVLEDAYEPPIHDFMFMDLTQSNNYIEDFFSTEQKLLVVMHDLDKVNRKAMPKIKALAEEWMKEGKPVWALTASSAEKAEAFRHEHNLPFELYIGDNTNLKSIIRSNPGLLLFTDTCTVKKVWPSTRLPKYKKLKKLTK